jgi:glutamate---cysteine ligase / carboxylate-amine ligase
MHVNLPFKGEQEFVRLHAAIRAVLPILPMLAASSPMADGRVQASLDHRMQVYRGNARRIPSIAGHIVPEPVDTIEHYHQRILEPMYADISPHDPQGILQEEWLNSRGAIARFDRNAIEIRVLDTQECPLADIAVAAAVTDVVRDLAFETHCSIPHLQGLDTARLSRLLIAGIGTAENTVVEDSDYLRALGIRGGSVGARTMWSRIIERNPPEEASLHGPLEHILSQGTLASRLRRAMGEVDDDRQSRGRLHLVYANLCEALSAGKLY